ncbi:hypothetical protein VNO77_37483 [Canavalia gladiata]|uniref:NAC domain-containing protein n=1 Tax=Canavalia gladiata TaxID=3824 RepID=A0AAN9KC51_CANGL
MTWVFGSTRNGVRITKVKREGHNRGTVSSKPKRLQRWDIIMGMQQKEKPERVYPTQIGENHGGNFLLFSGITVRKCLDDYKDAKYPLSVTFVLFCEWSYWYGHKCVMSYPAFPFRKLEYESPLYMIPKDFCSVLVLLLHTPMDSYYHQHHYDNNSEPHLPPGFRFHPTDEELITYYLVKKVLDNTFTGRAIVEVDLNKCEPWELPTKAKMGEKEWYFFSLRDRKYPTGLRTNRATEAGYWKATGKDREIYSSKTSSLVGMKKTLVFYRGRAPKGEKSNWVMHEYRLEGKFAYHYLSRSTKDEWVISRVFQKNTTGGGSAVSGATSATVTSGSKKTRMSASNASSNMSLCPEPSSPTSIYLPPLLESSPYTNSTATFNDRESSSFDSAATNQRKHVSCFSTITSAVDAATFDHLAPPPEPSLCQDAFSWFHRNNNAGISAFPNLRSLQDNLHMPFLFSPAMHGADVAGCGGVGNWPVPEEQRVADGGSGMLGVGQSELDCMWGY